MDNISDKELDKSPLIDTIVLEFLDKKKSLLLLKD